MTEAPDRMLARVRALLQQAEHPYTGLDEARAFTARAAEIMAKYGIDEALAAERGPDGPGSVTSVQVPLDQPYSTEKGSLLSHIARACRCQTVHHTWGRVTTSVTMFGYRSDLDRVAVLFASLLVQAAQALEAEAVPYDVRWEGRNAVAAWRRSWLVGYAQTVGARLHEVERRAARDADAAAGSGPGTALVLASREERVKAAVSEAFPKLIKNRRRLTGDGHARGQAAGRRADIGLDRVGGAARGQIGGA